MDMEEVDVSLGSDVKSPQDNGKDQVDDPTPHGMFWRHVHM